MIQFQSLITTKTTKTLALCCQGNCISHPVSDIQRNSNSKVAGLILNCRIKHKSKVE